MEEGKKSLEDITTKVYYKGKFMTDEKLYYAFHTVVLQEIPTEISLAFTITRCPNKCKGCHWSDLNDGEVGEELTDEIFINTLKNQSPVYSCVLFFGGEWKPKRLKELLLICKNQFSVKTALFTGKDMWELNEDQLELCNLLDYIKVGRYDESLGGLSSEKTNQKLINLKTLEYMNHLLIDKMK